MGRFARLRSPAVGWPVAPPPADEAPTAATPVAAPPPADEAPTAATPLAAPPPDEPRPGVAPTPRGTGAPARSVASAAPPWPPDAPVPGPTTALRAPPTAPAAAPPSPASTATVAQAGVAPAPAIGFRDRARAQRRLRYLRQVRELAFRDLGGFVFDAHRFNRPRQDIVDAKLRGLASMDAELRALELALGDRQELTLLREPGLTVCDVCAEIHGSTANFCPGCGRRYGSGAGPAGSPARLPGLDGSPPRFPGRDPQRSPPAP